jgi:hypothetical protein
VGEEEIKEASWAVQAVSGSSAYLYGIDYSKEKFKEEVRATIEHVKKLTR